MHRSITFLCLVLAISVPPIAADDAKPVGVSTAAPIINPDDYDALQRDAGQIKAVLLAIQPLKEKLNAKLEKLRAQTDPSTADATQFLIDANEKRLAKMLAQERQLKKSLAIIEARITELRHDPEQGPAINAEDQLNAAITQQETLLKAIPKLPDAKQK